MEVSLRRARALSQFASCVDVDPDAIQALRRDSLLSFSEASDLLAAPAHDVLEDWAILRWIEEQYAICEASLPRLAQAIGTYPAIRRTFRKWVSELVEQNPEIADSLLDSVEREASLSAQFRDDTLVALLRSSQSAELLQRHAASLFADDHHLLRRIVHLLRVGCVMTPAWFGGAGAAASIMHVPDGPAWECVLQLVASNNAAFDDSDLPLILGLTEDAARGVNWQNPYPDGSEAAIAIAYWLLPQFEDYRSEEQRKRVLRIIAKLPNCDRQRFIQLLEGDTTTRRRDHTSEDFREIVLWGMEGMPACRDMPETVIAATRSELMLTEERLRGRDQYFGSTEIEPVFGIRERVHFHSFPASAH